MARRGGQHLTAERLELLWQTEHALPACPVRPTPPYPLTRASLPALQLVKRMRFNTTKSLVMFRPHDITLHKAMPEGPEGLVAVPAMVADKANLGWVVKYTLRFDDDVVGHWSSGQEWAELQCVVAILLVVSLVVDTKALHGWRTRSNLDPTLHAWRA